MRQQGEGDRQPAPGASLLLGGEHHRVEQLLTSSSPPCIPLPGGWRRPGRRRPHPLFAIDFLRRPSDRLLHFSAFSFFFAQSSLLPLRWAIFAFSRNVGSSVGVPPKSA